MNKETMNKVFDWLEKEINSKGLYEFVLEDRNQITAYWKDTKKRAAQFYINQIIKILENDEEKTTEENEEIEKIEI